jgi:YD repeat-containing protein
MNKNYLRLLKYFVFFLSILGLSVQAQTLKYTYDALGRVTFVEDATNGNRDYDYDNAGNRLLVSINTANDDVAKPAEPGVPAAPTGLTVRGPFSPTGDGYNFSWNPVAGATSYEGQLKGGAPFSTTTQTSADSAGPRPDWVRVRFPRFDGYI